MYPGLHSTINFDWKGSVYLVEGNVYVIESVDFVDLFAFLISVPSLTWVTKPRRSIEATPFKHSISQFINGVAISCGTVRCLIYAWRRVTVVTSRVHAYSRFEHPSGKFIETVEIFAAPLVRYTTGLWFQGLDVERVHWKSACSCYSQTIQRGSGSWNGHSHYKSCPGQYDIICCLVRQHYGFGLRSSWGKWQEENHRFAVFLCFFIHHGLIRILLFNHSCTSSGISSSVFNHFESLVGHAHRMLSLCLCKQGCVQCLDS